MLSKCETVLVLTFLDLSDTFLGAVDTYFLVKMKINKNKVKHFLIVFWPVAGVIGRNPQGQRKKSPLDTCLGCVSVCVSVV